MPLHEATARDAEEICLSDSIYDESISITSTDSLPLSGPEDLATTTHEDTRLDYDASEKDILYTLGTLNTPPTPPPSCTSLTHGVLDESCISDFERAALPEFFRTSGARHGAKTPTRYLYIRTRVLQMYRQSFKGVQYMNKLTVRRQLLPEIGGDSGCYSRVHEFLERIGAINEEYVNTRGLPREKKFMYNAQGSFKRKRVLRSNDEYRGTIGNRTISHGGGTGKRPTRTRATMREVHLDPFNLVPLLNYPPGTGPFHVTVATSVITLMKLHAKLSDKEVIGMLGGHYHRPPLGFNAPPEQPTLTISMAIPCKVMSSTDTECDMDPVWEMAACEKFAALGLTTVGWYHSHPNFEANPSLRDIETQTSYQGLFRNEDHEPFIGFIISPSEASVECVHVSQSMDMHASFRMPYRLNYGVMECEADETALRDLLDQYDCHLSVGEILNKYDDL